MEISATIITFNEENNIARCIKSLSFVDEVIVVDSFSTDQTVKIAKQLGAKVIQHEFLGYGQQKNLAASHCQHEWILNIDADEEVDPDLGQQIRALNLGKPGLYNLNRRTLFCGRWISHGGWYPDRVNRLYHKEFAKWTEPHVHEDLLPITQGAQAQRLGGHLRHYSFPTIKSQIQTNLKYAELGAQDLIKRRSGKAPNLIAVCLRPLGKFIECYFLKRGFLDGREGFIIAINAAHSMFMKYSMAHLEGYKNEERH